MKIYFDLLMVSAIVVYIVDLSGFTQSWRAALARWLHAPALKPLKPFDCGQCMTWWCCLAFALLSGNFTLPVVAFSALMSFLSVAIGNALIAVREALVYIINKLTL